MHYFSNEIKTLFFVFIAAVSLWSYPIKAQIIIPFSFWASATATLVFSDASTYDFGSISINTNTDKTFTVSNTGSVAASAMTAATFSNAAYTFKGGPYSGTGGTCSAVLAPAGSCTVVV